MLKTHFLMLLVALAPTGFADAAVKLNDRQIVKALSTINQGEIDAAKTAEKKATTEEVKSFAKAMEQQHRENLKETTALAQKAGIDAENSPLARSLKKDGTKAGNDLQKEDGTSFDAAYVESQVKMHTQALATLNDDLIPNAQNGDLKIHLEKTRQAVEQHLAHAKDLQQKMKQ